MDKNIASLAPESIWKNFYQVTQIPRPSKKEARMVEFVKHFGEQLGLETRVDHAGNVIIRKPAVPGMESRKGVVLQAHLDMVPQKNGDKQHDFEKDPIEAFIDGDWVKANGTTLGADNGIGVASILAVLESKDLVHGPVEALFTVDEETGMTGAFALTPGQLHGNILLNLDSEDEGELYVGCAGGIDANIAFDYETDTIPGNFIPYEIRITGLKGGQSGLEINLGRGNSNQVLFRLLYQVTTQTGLRLCEVHGGNMRNAIPREAHALVMIDPKKEKDFLSLAEQYQVTVKKELAATEPGLSLTFSRSEMPSRVMTIGLQNRLIAAIYSCPNGVVRMSDGIPGLVETSTNLAIVRSENKQIIVNCLLRSSVESGKENLAGRLKALFDMAGAHTGFAGSYPGWKPNMNSPILKTMKQVYHSMYQHDPEIKAVHAGLECGIIGGSYPQMDMISFGPTIRHPHSPDEKVHIESVGKFWDFLAETLKNIPSQ
jgi:dipeptidase D